MTEAADTFTPSPPGDANKPPPIACEVARDRIRALTCDVGMVATVATGLADMLEDVADNGASPTTLRALVRLARAVERDASDAHNALDRLWLDAAPMRLSPLGGEQARRDAA